MGVAEYNVNIQKSMAFSYINNNQLEECDGRKDSTYNKTAKR